jgi:hypothetical protein
MTDEPEKLAEPKRRKRERREVTDEMREKNRVMLARFGVTTDDPFRLPVAAVVASSSSSTTRATAKRDPLAFLGLGKKK